MPYPVAACRGHILVNAAVVWYLSGGIAAANCIIAYKAKGAASYADSKINLANPGTYNATDGTGGAMAWNIATGWTNATSKFLKTGKAPASGSTALVRYSGFTLANNQCHFGEYDGNNSFLTQTKSTTTYTFYSGQAADGGTQATAAVLAIAGNKAFVNGVDTGITIPAWAGTTTSEMYIGAYNNGGATGGGVTTGYTYAFAYYDTVLTDAQVIAVSTAMAAL